MANPYEGFNPVPYDPGPPPEPCPRVPTWKITLQRDEYVEERERVRAEKIALGIWKPKPGEPSPKPDWVRC